MSASVNITALARQFHATTPNIRRRLDRLGVKPLQEILMPSGRKFVLFDSNEATQVLEQEKRAREQMHLTPVAVAVESPKPELKALQDEVTQLKTLMQQMLNTMTAPKG